VLPPWDPYVEEALPLFFLPGILMASLRNHSAKFDNWLSGGVSPPPPVGDIPEPV